MASKFPNFIMGGKINFQMGMKIEATRGSIHNGQPTEVRVDALEASRCSVPSAADHYFITIC